jgi:hypothetical protein
MTRAKGNAVRTLTQDDRPLVLLTLREAQAILDQLEPDDPDGEDDLARAYRVLGNQVTYIRDRI